MIFTVTCETCGNVEVGRTDLADAHAMTAILLLCHVDPIHSRSHVLRPRLVADMEETAIGGPQKHNVVISCGGSFTCQGLSWENVSMAEALLRVVAYHSHHEGHPLVVEIDGRIIYAPRS